MSGNRFTYHLTGSLEEELGDRLSPADRTSLRKIATYFLMGCTSVLFACVFGFALILKSWPVGLLAGLVYSYIYYMMFAVLFATVRKSQYLPTVVYVNRTEEILLKGHLFKGDRTVKAKEPDKPLNWRSIGSRIFSLLFFLIIPALFACLAVEQAPIERHLTSRRSTLVQQRVQAVTEKNRSANSAISERMSRLQKEATALDTRIDSLSRIADPGQMTLDDLEWERRKKERFERMHGGTLTFLQEEIQRLDRHLEEQAAGIRAAYSQSVFFTERVRYIFREQPYLSALILSVFLLLSMLPFIARYRMMIRPVHTLDEGLKQRHREIIARCAETFQRLREANRQRYGSFPDDNDHFEDPPFNTLAKREDRTILVKGSLTEYFDPSHG